MPMFPLGSVLFPGMPLPLRIFELRYRSLLRDRLAASERGESPEFGVVLIERGFEVGGGDERFGVGTCARLTHVVEHPDATYDTMAIGTSRLAVRAWLPDDPFPMAEVDLLDDLVFCEATDRALLEAAERQVRRALTLKAEMDEPAWSATTVLDDDPAAAAWQLAALAPVGALDQVRLLEAGSCSALLSAVHDLAEEECRVLQFRLGSG